jgi:outer membrane protein
MPKTPLLLLVFALYLSAQEAKFELGLGIGSLYYPNYIGSKSTQILTLPLPYIRYRGDFFRIDEDGISTKLFGINGLRLELSLSGSLPADSKDSGIRKDMPDLDLTGEIGPKLVYTIYDHGVSKLEFELPLRAVLSTNFESISYRGVVSNPEFKYSLTYSDFKWTLKSGIVFANKDYNSYFYGVDEAYKTPSRETYEAMSGLSGFKNRLGVTYQKAKWWAGAFISHYNISSATFRDSPLVETNSAFYMGASVAYIFYTLD